MIEYRNSHGKQLRLVLCCILTLTFSGCGGGGSSPAPVIVVPPPPPPPSGNEPLVITSTNAVDTIKRGFSYTETALQLIELGTNKLIRIANGELSLLTQGCGVLAESSLGEGVVELEEGNNYTIDYAEPCFQDEVRDQAGGSFVLQVDEAYVGKVGNSIIRGQMELGDDFFVRTSDPQTGDEQDIAISGALSFDVVISSNSVSTILVRFVPQSPLTFVLSDSSTSQRIDRLTALELESRNTQNFNFDDEYTFDFSVSVESQVLEGSFSCVTTQTHSSRQRSSPLEGRIECSGLSSAAALDSNRATDSEPLVTTVDGIGDGVFAAPLTEAIESWSEISEASFEESGLRQTSFDFENQLPELQTVTTIAAAISDVVYSFTNNKLYFTTANLIQELNPDTLAVERSITVEGIPTTLAISDDGSRLWYGLQDEERVASIDVASFTVSDEVIFEEDPPGFFAPLAATMITVVPGTTDQIVIVRELFDEVLAFNSGAQLPLSFSGEPTRIFFRNATQITGINEGSTGFNGYEITYDPLQGVVLESDYRELSTGFNSTLTLGNGNYVNSSGFVFDERVPLIKGIAGESLAGFNRFHQATVDPDIGRIYGVSSSGQDLKIVDEDSLARIGSYRNSQEFSSTLDGMIVTQNGLIIHSSQRVIRVDKSELVPNADAVECPVIDLSGVLVEGGYMKLGCNITDAIFDSARDRIYASIHPDSGPNGSAIWSIDGESLEVLGEVSVAGDARNLKISADGNTLLAVLKDSTRVIQIDLNSLTVSSDTNLKYSLDNLGLPRDPIRGQSIVDSPTGLGDFVVSSDDWEIRLFRDGESRGANTNVFETYNDLFVGQMDSSRLVASSFGRTTVFDLAGSGVSVLQQLGEVVEGRELVQVGDSLFTNFGQLFDMRTLTGSTACVPPSGFDFEFRPEFLAVNDDASKLAFFESRSIGTRIVLCDIQTGQVMDSFFIPSFGDDGNENEQRAFFRNNDLIFLNESSLTKVSNF